MVGEWITATLGEICEFRAGSVFKPALQGHSSGSYPFVKVSDMNLPANAVRVQDANNWVSEDDLRELQARPFPPGTVVFAKIGEALRQNRLRQVVRETIVDNNMMGAVPSTAHVDPRFFYYALSKYDFSDIAQGTALPYLTVSALSGLTLDLPPLPEQRAIAHILGTLDDKIELNRRMNETLEAMARALFKSWFVDFDPVRAKAEGRDPDLPKPLAALFPDSFEDSELGEIPKGWRVATIRELASDIQYGFTQSASTEQVGPHFLRITDIQGGKVDWGTVPFCEVTPEEHERYRLEPGDVLVARTGASTGENIYLPSAPDAVFASYLVRFQFPDVATARSVGAFMRTQAYFDYVAGCLGGSAQPNASAQVLAGAQLVAPTLGIARMFTDFVMPLDKRIAASNEASRTLATLRDTLLPKLISGELRTPVEVRP